MVVMTLHENKDIKDKKQSRRTLRDVDKIQGKRNIRSKTKCGGVRSSLPTFWVI